MPSLRNCLVRCISIVVTTAPGAVSSASALINLGAIVSKYYVPLDTSTYVLQSIVTFGPFSMLVKTSSVPWPCLMTTRYLPFNRPGWGSLMDICVTSMNLRTCEGPAPMHLLDSTDWTSGASLADMMVYVKEEGITACQAVLDAEINCLVVNRRLWR